MKNISAIEQQEFNCFIFSDDINQIEKLLSPDTPRISCKFLSMETEFVNIRKSLVEDYGVNISRVDLIDSNTICIISKNYKKISKIPEIKLENNEYILNNLKSSFIILGSIKITELNRELYNMKNKKNAKYRNKTKQLNMLRNVLSKDFAEIY